MNRIRRFFQDSCGVFVSIFFVAGGSAALPTPSHAGWSSSGGEIVQDSQNPWFVKNKRLVTACVEIDESAFGVTEERSRVMIGKAWAFWQRTFSDFDKGRYGVASQELVIQENCELPADIRFQLGTLSAGRRRQIPDLSRFVALSVRTEYDRKNLAGKGFVYVAPQAGPLRPKDKEIHTRRWELGEGSLLQLTLMHELGHVFGLTHGEFEKVDLMGSLLLEFVTNRTWAEEAAEELNKMNALNWNVFGKTSYGCSSGISSGNQQQQEQFFGLPVGGGDLDIRLKGELLSFSFLPVLGKGSGLLTRTTQLRNILSSVSPKARIYLPEEQTVFPEMKPPHPMNPHISYGHKETNVLVGKFKTFDGSPEREILIDTTRGGATFNSVFEGKPVGDLFCDFRGDFDEGSLSTKSGSAHQEQGSGKIRELLKRIRMQ